MGDWSAATDYNVTQWLLAKSKAKEVKPLKTRIQRFEDHWIASLVFVLQAGDKKIERECSTRINLVNTQCPECSRRSAGYYEAVIQVRRSSPATPQEKLARAAEKLRRKLEKTSFVSRVEEKKEGIDLYVGSAPAARSALEELSKGFEASKTLAGRKQGREVYRTTFCVRI
jgi:nonsense-mediated mRNA decay protein 3